MLTDVVRRVIMFTNTALLASRYELNYFTSELAKRCQNQGSCLVALRAGNKVNVSFHTSEYSGAPEFFTHDWEYVWNADGSSVTSKDYDIISFV